MSVSDRVMYLLRLRGMKQIDLLDVLEMSSRQSLSNKFALNRWSASDLMRVANVTGCELAFILPDGERIQIKD